MQAAVVHVLNTGLALGCGALARRIGLTLAPMVTMKGPLATSGRELVFDEDVPEPPHRRVSRLRRARRVRGRR